MKIKVSNYIAQFLVDKGITDCFMVTGGGAMHLDDALGHQEGMQLIFNHHEQACAIAAEGYTRMTGRLAAVCVTSGPGGTNAITGVMGGWVDSIPMLVLSGQVKRETTIFSCPQLGLRQLGDQEFDIIHSVENMTKYATMLTDPLEVAYVLEKALYTALDGRGGPVWIDVPLDVQGAYVETDQLRHFDPASDGVGELAEGNCEVGGDGLATNELAQANCEAARVAADDITAMITADGTTHLVTATEDTISLIYEKLKTAKAPLLLAGTGIRLGDAEEELLALIDKWQIPVITAWNANDTVAFDNPYFVGMPGTVGIRSGNFAVQNCDLLISLGCRLNIRMISYNRFDFAKNAFKIVVDIDPKELTKPTIHPDLPVCGDVKDVLGKLLEKDYTPVAAHAPWAKWCRDLLMKYPAARPAYRNGGEGLINPYIFMDTLFEQLEPTDRIICGNGSACVITFQAAKIKQGQRMFTNSGCAAMGYGFPAALGVAVADNTHRTICVDGDGSIMMNIQELATVAHNLLDIKIIILNNNGYHSIRQTQRNLFKPPFIGIDGDSGLSFPDFGKLADAFGLPYFMLDSEANAADVLREALATDGPCIIEAVVDPSQNFEPKSSSKILPDGKIVSPSLEDMFPFLTEEEMEENVYIR